MISEDSVSDTSSVDNSSSRGFRKPQTGSSTPPKRAAQTASTQALMLSGLDTARTSGAGRELASATGPTVTAKDAKKWERIQAQLKTQLGADVYASWFGRCRLESVSKSQVVLSVPTTFLKSWIRNHYKAMILQLWQDQSEHILQVDIIVRSVIRNSAPLSDGQTNKPGSVGRHSGEEQQPSLAQATGKPSHVAAMSGPNAVINRTAQGGPLSQQANAASSAPATLTSGFSGSPLDQNYTFSTFVEGASNRMACAAARSVAEADGAALRFNPLFIHASVGLGKTHLLQAIAWAAAERNNGVKILYLTAEYFMWRFASAIRDQSALTFKESLRDIDLLLIDDMQFLQGKSIQQEFCHLLNALIDSAKQVVVAADRPPAQLESLDARVRSRLQGGVALEVKSPGLEMRREMLELRYRDAQREDATLDVPEDVLDFVATKVTSSGRDLEGAFNQLLIQHRFSEGPVDRSAVEKLLGHLVQSGEQKRVRIEDIQKVVAKHYNVSKNDLLSNRRTRVIVRPRQISMYLSKTLTPRSLPEIGRRFGGRDHTTVLHAVRKIEQLLTEDHKLAQEIELLKRLIDDDGL